MFTILVCGGRDYTDRARVNNALTDLCDKKGLWGQYQVNLDLRPASGLRVVTGAARGADTFALEWAMMNGASFKGYPPEYDKYPSYSAPVIRNQQMLDEESVNLVILWRI